MKTRIGNLALDGPGGWGAGGNKTGKQLLADQALGARFHVVGGVTLEPQRGKQMPRLLTMDERVDDHGRRVSLNAYGFPNSGARATADNIARQRATGALHTPVIVQLTVPQELYEPGRQKEIPGMIERSARIVASEADALGLGLSSPNVAGMRAAQQFSLLRDCVSAAQQGAASVGPERFVILKGDGDGGQARLDMYCDVVRYFGPHSVGLELINTTGLSSIKEKYGAEHLPGGLAGDDPDYRDLAQGAVSYVYGQLDGEVDIIGCGGLTDAGDAMNMMRKGARAWTMLTARRSQGLGALVAAEQGLTEMLNRMPEAQVLTDVVGVDTI
jgi:dihydroorotate dehydrogenase